jgi:hypothetical protein
MERAIFFVDGFNLYHAIAANPKLRKYKWFNLDLIPAIRAVKKTFPNKKIKLVLPPQRQSKSLKHEAQWFMRMKEKHLINNQFLVVIEKNGVRVEKP